MARSRASTRGNALATEAAAGFLFGPGRPFDRFPGGVLLAGDQGQVIAANEAAGPIAAALRRGDAGTLCAALDAALGGAAARLTPLVLGAEDAEQGVDLAFDVTILPWSDGAAG